MLIFAIFLYIVGVILLGISFSDDVLTTIGAIVGTFAIICASAIIVCKTHKPPIEPKPIDVYNGKTTLEISYRDSVPVDTVVVWKPEFDPKRK